MQTKNIKRKRLGGVPLRPPLVGYDSSDVLYEKGLVATIELLAMSCLLYEKCLGHTDDTEWNQTHPVVKEWLEWANGDKLLAIKDDKMVTKLKEMIL